MTSFAATFGTTRSEGRAALFPYMMSGLFGPEGTVGVFLAMAEAGADGFEIGIPYADPLMDGPVIQEAGRRALEAGTTLEKGLQVTERVAGLTGMPCAVMTYVNPILKMGPAVFARRAIAAGASAAIVADLPVDESAPFAAAFGEAGLGLVQFAAPTTTDARLDAVVSRADPFVYGIAEMGVTGERDGSTSRAAELAARIKSRSDVPLVLGVGFSDSDQARVAAGLGDGVIVGSALVRRVLEADSAGAAAESVAGLVRDLAAAVRSSAAPAG